MTIAAHVFDGKLFNGGLFNSGLFMGGASTPSDPLTTLISSLFGSSEQGGLYLPSLSTCYTDNGTTLCTAPGDLVYRIDDLSGNENHCIQASEAARPALQQTAGGLWYLDFDGVDDELISVDAAIPGIGSSFFAALGIRADTLSGTTTPTQLFGLFKTTTSLSGCSVRLSGGTIGQCSFRVRYAAGTQTFSPYSNSSLTDLAPHVAAGGYDGAEVYNRIDGVALTPPTARTPTASEGGNFIIGGKTTGGAHSFFGGVYSAISSVTTETIELAEQVMADLCGVTLP